VIIKSLPLLLVSVLSAQGAALSVGIIGGAPFSDVAKSSVVSGITSIPKSNNFTVGPVVQVNLPANFRLEVDALFRPYKVNFTGLLLRPNTEVSAQQWRFPAMIQYRFGGPVVRPYVGAGLSFGHLSSLSAAAKSITSGPGQLLHQSDASPVIGAGVDVGLPLIRVSAELRYTRQTVSYFQNFSNLNQAELLVGIHF
jgi:hypothetical protein